MKVLLFGGTIEGRKLAEAIALSKTIEACHVCVATEYGALLLPEDDRIVIHHERMDMEEISRLIRSVGFDICIDATHPFATLVSRNIKDACDECAVTLYRLLRDDVSDRSDINSRYFDSVHDAVEYLKGTEGNILTSTGSKELKEFTVIEDYRTRVYARVLPVKDVVAACEEMGFSVSNLYCMQGPFSVEMNIAMIKACHARYIVTKASGSAGGFDEKYEAAMQTGTQLIVIGRPAEVSERVCGFEEILSVLGIDGTDGLNYVNRQKRAYLIGTGCGDPGQLTLDAMDAIRNSSCIIGAQRMIDNLKIMSTKKAFVSYNPDEIIRYLKENGPDTVAILYSGDIGFFSGAAGIGKTIEGYETVRIPGISSGAYLCDRLGISWQDVRFLSCHGRELDISREVTVYDKLLILLGDPDDAAKICNELCKLNMNRALINIGERLSYKDEKIAEGAAEEFISITTDPLAVMLIRLRP